MDIISRRDRLHLALKTKTKSSDHQSLLKFVSAYENLDLTMKNMIHGQHEKQLTEKFLLEEMKKLREPSEEQISEYMSHAKTLKNLHGRLRWGLSSVISSKSKHGNEHIITNLRNYASSIENEHEKQMKLRNNKKNAENEQSKNSMKYNKLSEINQLLTNSGLDVHDESKFKFKPEIESNCFGRTWKSESTRRDKLDESRKQFDSSILDMVGQIKNKRKFPNTELKF